jgi:hypothetical protein
MGLQSTGKTSFLAALWYMVDQQEVSCALSLENLDGDRTYLNTICKAWMEYKAVLRTPADSEKLASMTLKDKDGKQIKLVFPDLSGESFFLQWSKRQLTVGYDHLMQKASGGILFVSSEKIDKPHRLDTVALLAAEVGDTPEPTESEPPKYVPWDIEKAPTQVQLVELLQVIASREYFRPPFQLAVVLSAFDVVGKGVTPKEFITSQFPLLDQYLASNPTLFDVRIFGISAQGGRYAKPDFTHAMILHPDTLNNRLKVGRDAVSLKIWADFEGRASIETETDPAKLRTVLTELFNNLLPGFDLYDAERFKGISLRPATKDLLETHLRDQLDDADIKRLNRMLLEDVFTTELSKDWEYAKEQATMENQIPANRVLIVGEGVANKHDITEPIQWLMR